MTDSSDQTELNDASTSNETIKPLQMLSKRTTPTWEMELLISGATVFGLMQLPGPLNDLAQGWIYSNEKELASFLLVLAMYLQFSLLTLIATFVLHLLMRGYWVALVGMYSVYPDGIRWDDSRSFGPIYRQSGESTTLEASAVIEAADNRATKVFGLGFGVAMSLIMPSLMVGLFLLALLAVQALNLDAGPWFNGFWLLFALIFMPFLVAYALDRWRGQELLDKGRAGGLMRVFNVYARFGMGRTSNPLLALATSQVGNNRGSLYMIAGMMPVMIVISLVIMLRGRDLDNGAFDALPRYQPAAEHSLHNGHYASLRVAGETDVRLPFLPDPFVREDRLRLFIPYNPAQHTPLMRRECPQAMTSTAIQRGEGLQCIVRLHELRIDGQAVSAALLGGADPVSGQRGTWAVIDLTGLADGQHELVVQQLMKLGTDGKPREKPLPWRIPFWKQAANN